MKTLLQKAESIKAKKYTVLEASEEEVELALGWMRGAVTLTQVAAVIDKNPSNTQGFISRALKKAYKNGRLCINLNP